MSSSTFLSSSVTSSPTDPLGHFGTLYFLPLLGFLHGDLSSFSSFRILMIIFLQFHPLSYIPKINVTVSCTPPFSLGESTTWILPDFWLEDILYIVLLGKFFNPALLYQHFSLFEVQRFGSFAAPFTARTHNQYLVFFF